MPDGKYNGWANWETGSLGMYLSNNEPDNTRWDSRARELWNDKIEEADGDAGADEVARVRKTVTQLLAEEMKEEYGADSDNFDTCTAISSKVCPFYTDFLSASLREVDWEDLADGWVDTVATGWNEANGPF